MRKNITLLFAFCFFLLLTFSLHQGRASAATIPIGTAYSDFLSNQSLLQVNGDASILPGGSLSLTPASTGQAGSVFYMQKFATSGLQFSTFFKFQFAGFGGGPGGAATSGSNSSQSLGADGITFCIQPNSNTAGSTGGGLGYQTIGNSVAVEFDSYNNTGNPTYDPNDDHIAVDYDGSVDHKTNSAQAYGVSNGPVDTTLMAQGFDLKDGNAHYVWIDYDGTTLTVRLGSTNSRAASTLVLSDPVDLSSYINTNNVYVGFTGSTGGSYEEQDILQWYYANEYDPIDTSTNDYTFASTNNSLDSLAISAGALNPGFSSNQLAYTDSVDYDTTSVTVTPTVADPTATVTVNGTAVTSGSPSGPINLNVGTNTIDVVVTAQNGAIQTYTITVTRELEPTTTDLTASPNPQSYGSPVTLTAVVYGSNPTGTVTFYDDGASIGTGALNSGTATLAVSNLSVGTHSNITAAYSGDTDNAASTSGAVTETINPAGLSGDNYLSSLTISPGTLTPSFSPAAFAYTASVSNNISSDTVTAVADSVYASVYMNGVFGAIQTLPLNVGPNSVAVKVYAQDGTQQVYAITITRAGRGGTGGSGNSHISTPAVQTDTATAVTDNSAVLNGNIVSDNGYDTTEYGFIWGDDSSSLTNTLKVGTDNHSGSFTATLGSLTTGTTYYFQAYAKNSEGSGQGAVISFTAVAASQSPTLTPTTPTTPAGFSDVSASFWAHDTIGKLSGLGYINGYPDGTFRPDKPITRAEVAAIMGKVLKLAPAPAKAGTRPQNQTFNDVNPDDWFYQAVETANHAGIEIGYQDGTFRPNDPISRQEIACVLVQALGQSQQADSNEKDLTKFIDDHDIAWWSRGYVFVALQHQIVSGYPNGAYQPENETTRAEACTMISNFLNTDK